MGLISDIGSSIIDAINSLLADSGEWTASVLDTGLKVYNKFINFGFSLITKDIKSDFFKVFWDVIDFLNDVCVAIGSTLLVALFLYNLVNTVISTPRSEVNMEVIIYAFVKMLFCNFLVANALNIVVAIFRFGTNMVIYGIRQAGGEGFAEDGQGLPDDISFICKNGLSGLTGLFGTIVAIIGTVAIFACAVGILMQIVIRFFKMFVLIPFSSLSFSTAVMSDGNGSEIFKGYIKHLLAVSLEAAVMVLCLIMASAYTNGGMSTSGIMSELFDLEKDINFQTVQLDNEEEVQMFEYYAQAKCSLYKMSGLALTEGMSSRIDDMIISDSTGKIPSKIMALDDFSNYQVVPINGYQYVGVGAETGDGETGSTSSSITHIIQQLSPYRPIYPVEGQVCTSLSLGGVLILILQLIFPMLIAAKVVSEASNISRSLIGM